VKQIPRGKIHRLLPQLPDVDASGTLGRSARHRPNAASRRKRNGERGDDLPIRSGAAAEATHRFLGIASAEFLPTSGNALQLTPP
jgi:hypothetical protein